MLITFKSKAAGDIHMFRENAQQLLEIIGKTLEPSVQPRGIITAAEVPAALARLAEAARQARAARGDDAQEQDSHAQMKVGLGQRAFPLVDMLERAAKINADIVWGV